MIPKHLYNVASKDKTRLVLNAVYVTEAQLVTSDGGVLLAVPNTYAVPPGVWPRRKPSDKTPVAPLDASYPNWRAVVPSPAPDVLPQALSASDEAAVLASGEEFTLLTVCGRTMWFETKKLRTLITAVRKLGVKGPLMLQPMCYHGSDLWDISPLAIVAPGIDVALIMPTRPR